jgi:hypothetical protein
MQDLMGDALVALIAGRLGRNTSQQELPLRTGTGVKSCCSTEILVRGVSESNRAEWSDSVHWRGCELEEYDNAKESGRGGAWLVTVPLPRRLHLRQQQWGRT